MAKMHIVLLSATMRGLNGINAPDSVAIGSDTKTLTGVSQLSDLVGQPGQVWRVVLTGGDAFTLHGAGTPVAAEDAGHLLPAGGPYEFNVSVANERVALIASA